jgi:hypothetical protein
MAAYKGAIVTKYDAGGSGDNYIPDGYIKSVEKIWLDSYALGSASLTTADTLVIAKVPKNKKITSVEVYFPDAATTDSALTGGTLNVGVTGALTKFIDAVELATTYKANRIDQADGVAYVTTSDTTDIVLSIGRKAITLTAGTIKTVVRYT